MEGLEYGIRLGSSITMKEINAMAIRSAKIVAIEGTHGSGKTTLVHSAVGYFRAMGINACDVPESARLSPFFESALLYDGPSIDKWAELHLIGDQIANEQARARVSDLLFIDRTVLNAASYWMVRFPACDDILFQRTREFLLEYARAVYDMVFFLRDTYPSSTDDLRETDETFRRDVELRLHVDLNEAGVKVIEVPKGIEIGDRLKFIADSIKAID